jgi:UDP-N-acetylmuramoyl-L-alanyl-D-glutamate--2,6-diaminopimelate ligase
VSATLSITIEPPSPVRLSAIAGRLRAAALLVAAPAADDPVITGVAADSRLLRAGDLYCAWRGTTSDAHDYLAAAAAAGAAAALVERSVAEVDLPQLVVRDGRRAAAVGAAVVYGDPQSALRTVGVTGTNGKTTTVWILRHLLSAHYPTASLGTLGLILENGESLPGSEALTTPGPVELAATLHFLVQRDVQAIAMEVSSHALEQGRVHALDFDVAIFTNLSRDHLDYHGTFEAYLEAKLLLGEMLRPGGTAVVNADDPAWSKLVAPERRALRFAEQADADLRAENVELGAFGARFDCVYSGQRATVSLPLIGAFNVHNALAAVAALLALGFPLDETAVRLGSVPQVPGRLERIATAPCAVLRDYAHTPDALERALAALRPLTPGRLIVLFGAGGDRDRGKRPLMGAVAQRQADIAIVTSDNPRTEDPASIIEEIEAGMDAGRHVRLVDRRAAIAHALSIATAEDVVLLAGKGHETYQIVGHEKHPFDEREIVGALLAGRRGGV